MTEREKEEYHDVLYRYVLTGRQQLREEGRKEGGKQGR